MKKLLAALVAGAFVMSPAAFAQDKAAPKADAKAEAKKAAEAPKADAKKAAEAPKADAKKAAEEGKKKKGGC